jgi:hypothetical protein
LDRIDNERAMRMESAAPMQLLSRGAAALLCAM